MVHEVQGDNASRTSEILGKDQASIAKGVSKYKILVAVYNKYLGDKVEGRKIR